ncbi:hypothetical protein Mal4_51690 [Maioricimonas rarisocia]|uniref:Zincin peptidase n=1 Tax=Maioricimonas rarisocia TaxID=2528026 RepID=A0A517ZED2_9PLAN|nr:DUF3267 domain-containing protein [Maioricimonas rarisocia]QDU40809.1 hypothetical protein Mal4_51690 [Maioricimonas rarisocia]
MRFVLGPIPPSETIGAIASGWTPMTSSNELRWVRVTSVTGMLMLLVAGFLALQQAASLPDVAPWYLVGVIASTLFLVPLHELLHCLGYLVPLRSRALVTGIWLSTGTWYVVYDSPLPRWRVLVMLAAPFVCLSVFPCIVYPFVSGSNAWTVTFLVLVHGALCVGDIITFARICTNIPAGSLVHNCGWTTCWYTPPTDVTEADDNPMHPSGEGGCFQVDNLSSPP